MNPRSDLATEMTQGDLEKLPACPNRDVDSENTYESKGEQTRIIWRRFLGNRRLVAIFRGPL